MKEKRKWENVINEYKDSGLIATMFCKEHHIPSASFYKHKQRYSACKQLIFTPVSIKQDDMISFFMKGIRITCKRPDLSSILEATQ